MLWKLTIMQSSLPRCIQGMKRNREEQGKGNFCTKIGTPRFSTKGKIYTQDAAEFIKRPEMVGSHQCDILPIAFVVLVLCFDHGKILFCMIFSLEIFRLRYLQLILSVLLILCYIQMAFLVWYFILPLTVYFCLRIYFRIILAYHIHKQSILFSILQLLFGKMCDILLTKNPTPRNL